MGRKKRLCDGLRVRYEKRADLHEVFLSLACALICWSVVESRAGGLSKPRFGKLNSAGIICSFAYSPLATFRMGTSGSASFQRARKSL
jgi:hypothetical protein